MSLFKILDIAGSGMSAQSLRLNTTASNMANAESVSGSEAEAYRARQPVFSAVMSEFNKMSASTGVKVDGIVESKAPIQKQHNPGHPPRYSGGRS